MNVIKAIGLMSGTSLDGIDAAYVYTDGKSIIERQGFKYFPYNPELRDRLRANLNKPRDPAVEQDLTAAHATAVNELIESLGLKKTDVDVIGFHGHTIVHDPSNRFTCQIGDGKALAAKTGLRVVNDFRTADVESGGQGAPFAPVYHAALAANLPKPVVMMNIGGVSNITYIPEQGDPIAFDCGPGNALLDDWVREKTGQDYDEDGQLSLQGQVDQGILEQLLKNDYFDIQPPKSLDRDHFVSDVWHHLSTEDGAATLAAFTVEAILRAQRYLPQEPRQWIISGGGRHNAAIMQGLARDVTGAVVPIEKIELNGDAIEAELFAYLAVRALQDLPLSFPTTTGVPEPMRGGVIHDP